MTDPTEPTLAKHAPRTESAPELLLPEVRPANNAALAFELHQLFRSTLVHDEALGRVKALALQLAQIQHAPAQSFEKVVLEQPQLVVFAADHGICDEGVSVFPQEATRQRVLHMLRGKGSTNALATLNGVQLSLVDAGVASHLLPADHGRTAVPLLPRKIGYGTRNMVLRPAMSPEQVVAAMRAGMDVVRHLPGNVIALGDVGVGSTSCATLLLVRLCGVPLEDACGRGSGLDDAQFKIKLEVLQQTLRRHRKAVTPMEILAAMGGFEIAMMVGAMLQAASERRVVVIDGFVSTAAALVARALSPNVMDYLIFAHRSAEPGHRLMLIHLQVQPVVDMELRMGQGLGTLLAWPLIKAAEHLVNDH
ncbi:MAG: nicotinate-nucleotide--dimethylbenzimidazole phosphoribosyltransferase [Burkholderiaceae bacterium]